MMTDIDIGDIIFIPSEGKEYVVYSVNDNEVKLVNYQNKEKLTIDKETYRDIKDIVNNVDRDYLNDILDGIDFLDESSNGIDF